MGELGKVPGGSIFASYVMAAYTQTYDDVSLRRYVRPGAQAILKKLAGRCLAEPSVLVSVLSSLSLTKDPELFARDPATGALGRRLRDDIPTARIEAPLLIAQGGSDGLVLPTVQRAYVAARCAAGQPLDYTTYAGRGHVPLVEADSPLVPDLLRWTADRLAGRPAPDNCSSLP
jgi:pimeloyl-ACP methyl ester carboxylesterase